MKQLGQRVAAASAVALVVTAALGAAARAAEPVEIEATWRMGGRILSGEKRDHDDGVITLTGGSWQEQIVETSDPRLDGTLSVALNHTIYGVGGPEVFVAGFRIENDDGAGAWQELPRLALAHPRGLPTADFTTMLIGEGTHAGHFAIVDVRTDFTRGEWSVRGYIIEGDPPTTPASLLGE